MRGGIAVWVFFPSLKAASTFAADCTCGLIHIALLSTDSKSLVTTLCHAWGGGGVVEGLAFSYEFEYE